MTNNRARSTFTLGAIWTLASAGAWIMGREVLHSNSVSGLSEITEISLSLLLPATLIGLVLGLAGILILRSRIENAMHWLIITTIAYPAFLVGSYQVVISGLLGSLARMNMVLQSEGGGASITPSPLLYIPLAGFLLAIVQLPMLRIGARSSVTKSLLWVFGSQLAFALGWIGSTIVNPLAYDPTVLDGSLMGGISGAAIYLLVIAITREDEYLPEKASSL